MSKPPSLPAPIVIRDTCLCLATQQAARVLARRFDTVFRPLGITNNQFSLMTMLSGATPPLLTRLGPALAMDRTTVTAALKALERRGLVIIEADRTDRRGRRPRLTEAGRAVLAAATPIWRDEHAALETDLPALDPEGLRRQLAIIRSSQGQPTQPKEQTNVR